MLTTTKNGLTYIEGTFLGETVCEISADKAHSRMCLAETMKRTWKAKGYAVPSGWELDVEAVVIV